MFEKNKYKTELIIPLFDGKEIIYNTLWATTGEQKVITVEANTHLVCYTAVLESSRNAPPHLWRGALRDDTKNGCVADYHPPNMPKLFHSKSYR